MRKMVRTSVVLSLVLAAQVLPAWAFPTPLTTVRIHPPSLPSPLYRPVFLTSPPGDTGRLFIVEQRTGSGSTAGRIQLLNIPSNALVGTVLLTTSQSTGNEEGLLGMAFHPDFFAPMGNPNRAAFFIYLTKGGNNHVFRYTMTGQDPNASTADSATAERIITFNHPSFSNHNGGWIAFGPDGYLYIATGDGGSGCDPSGNSCNTNSYLGKIHRLDVSADQFPGDAFTWGYTSPATNPFFGATPGLDEIWFYGLRNPYRNSFDRLTGAMYLGDVGQNAFEEIDYVAPGVSGLNFGWDIREGFSASSCTTSCSPSGLTDPIWEYGRGFGALCGGNGVASVTGGYVYRGSLIPDLQGTYFFADYCLGTISSFKYSGSGAVPPSGVTSRTAELAPGGGMDIRGIGSFGEDQAGELYILDSEDREIFKIVVNCAGSGLAFFDHPDSQTIPACDPVTFSVALTDTRGAVTYTWRKDFNPVLGAPNAPVFTIPAVGINDGGFYDVVVTDQCGSVTSAAGLLTVDPAGLEAGDINRDCAVDLVDVDIFVNVLLEVDLDPIHVARSDLNNDTFTDGLDAQGMVDALLP